MRPIRLTLEGFISFRERTEIDFSELDLFAIVGQTGSGKTALLDAITWALFGQTSRLGKTAADLISHGANKVVVHLGFAAGEKRYRVARTAKRTGSPQIRFEKQESDSWRPMPETGAAEINEAVCRIVGLDFKAFTRSVILPQGKFDAFLRGDHKERREILKSLLGLEVYDRMREIAGEKARSFASLEKSIRELIDRGYADVHPDKLRSLAAELQQRRDQQLENERQLSRADELWKLATQLQRQRKSLAQKLSEQDQARKECSASRVTASEAAAELDKAMQSCELIEARLGSIVIDEIRYEQLLKLNERSNQIARFDQMLADSRAKLERASATHKQQQRAMASAEMQRKADEQRRIEAAKARDQAWVDRESLRARKTLRTNLEVGEPCPVCEQVVRAVPEVSPASGSESDYEYLEAQCATAEAVARQTADKVMRLDKEVATLSERIASLNSELSRLREQSGAIRPEVEAAGGGVRIAAELRTHSEARIHRISLEAELKKRSGDARQARDRKVEADQRAAVLSERTVIIGRDIETLASEIADLERIWTESVTGFDLPAGPDKTDRTEKMRKLLTTERLRLVHETARLDAAVSDVESRIAKLAGLNEQLAEFRSQRELFDQLAHALRADRFIAYLLERAYTDLCAKGSEHLLRLSQERYSFSAGKDEFFVKDGWNADAERSAATLSGGESFLASLALALALADSVASFGPEGTRAATLEALFLDEGVSTLDEETLSAVVDALTALQNGNRLIGVISHSADLAERLPARIEITKHHGCSTLKVEEPGFGPLTYYLAPGQS